MVALRRWLNSRPVQVLWKPRSQLNCIGSLYFSMNWALCSSGRASERWRLWSTVHSTEVAKREDETNGLTHKLAYISGQSGEEWADLDEGKSMIRNQFHGWSWMVHNSSSFFISTFFGLCWVLTVVSFSAQFTSGLETWMCRTSWRTPFEPEWHTTEKVDRWKVSAWRREPRDAWLPSKTAPKLPKHSWAICFYQFFRKF